MNSSNLVITGVGVVSSIGLGREAFTRSLMAGESGLSRLSESASMLNEHVFRRYRSAGDDVVLDAETAVVAGVMDFDAKRYVKPRKALKVMCREIQTAYAASSLAVEEAGLQGYLPAEPLETDSPSGQTSKTDRLGSIARPRKRICYTQGGKIQSDRIGTVFGSELFYGPPDELSDAFAESVNERGDFDASYFGNAAMRRITPLWLLKYLPNMPACHYSIVLNAHGPNNSITVGDTSGHAALIEACGYLQRDVADFLVVSATGTRLNATRSLFTEDQPLATVVDPLWRSSRPHALDANGLVRGEGAGSLLVERADTASARGVTPIARVLGYASRFIASNSFANGDRNTDLRHDAGRGSAAAIAVAMRGAMQHANITADQIGGLVGHAAGDPVIDACEREAIGEVLPGVPLTLPISLLGHCGAASGMMGILAGCVILQTGQIPPVPHAEVCNAVAVPSTTRLNVSDQVRDLEKRVVMVISHTSPGNATAVILASP